jgi:processive 1,2-diacylglycerol beta-glucosyltransferase
MLRHARPLWGLAYDIGDRLATGSPLTFGVTRVGMGRLAALLARDRLDAVVSVHATPAVVMAALAAAGRRVPPHATVVTDFVAHGQWIAPGIDRYCVAAPEVEHEFIARGIPRQRVLVTGVPVRPEFEESLPMLEARHALGLDVSTPVVLVMAGSDAGLGRLDDVAAALGRLAGPVQVVFITGRDRRLARRLRRTLAGRPVRVLPYVEDVRRMMAAADLLVTKAGGMTLAEAIAAELPMVIYGSLPGQERRNERFASRAGIALVAHSRRDLAAAIERALRDADLLEHLRQRLRRVRQPGSARRIARVVLEGAHVAATDLAPGDGA